jgi:hypothetical protein
MESNDRKSTENGPRAWFTRDSPPPTPSKASVAPSTGPGALLPALSLPKGGGAIRGIGETFSTTPATGTLSLSIPIATSPGRAGFDLGPQLTYDSGAGNGPFGPGWRLSTPSITRERYDILLATRQGVGRPAHPGTWACYRLPCREVLPVRPLCSPSIHRRTDTPALNIG